MEDIKSDEIDLFDLIKVIYRWKYLVLGIVLTGIVIVSIIFYKAPVSYSSTGTIKIGKIAGTPIEKYEDLNLYLLSIKGKDKKFADIVIDKKSSSPGLDTLVLSLSSIGSEFDETHKIIDETAYIIIKRHEKIYSESFSKLKSIYLNNVKNVGPNYYLIVSSYSYPTEMIGEVETIQKKSVIKLSVDETNKTLPLPLKGLLKYLIISVIAFTFCGIMAAFVLDYILSEVKKRKN